MNGTSTRQSISIWQGTRVRLRVIEPSNWETYFAWNKDDEMTRALFFIPFPQSQEFLKRFAEHAAMQRPEGDNFRFVIEKSEQEVVGDITTLHCDQRTGNFSWGLNIIQEHRCKGYTFEALPLSYDTIFKNSATRRSRYTMLALMKHQSNCMSVLVSSRKVASEEPTIRMGSTLMTLCMA
jgi:RimJ/RimL family protein N-acetyltransferase